MKFTEGDVSDAIAECRKRNALFVVFVDAGDDLSQRYRQALEEDNQIRDEDYVAVCIPSTSPSRDEFLRIYGAVPLPSVFVIGSSGRPVAIASPPLDQSQVVRIVTSAFSRHVKNDSSQVRLLLKLPTGDTAVVAFPAQTSLREVRVYVRDVLKIGYPFRMTISYPRRVFTADDEDKSLTTLDLQPTSTILVVAEERFRVMVYRAVASFADDIIRRIRRIIREVKQWVTRSLSTP